MIKRDSGFVRIINEPAKSRIERGECPACGLPKDKWKRRKTWRCCSKECTEKFESFCIIRTWQSLREKCLERDNYTCKRCGKISVCNIAGYRNPTMIADHIIPIALGGEQWDINNLQTLCEDCNKIKTREDMQKITIARRNVKYGRLKDFCNKDVK